MAFYDSLREGNFLLPRPKQPFLPGTRSERRDLYIGLPQWTNKFNYPRGTAPADMLKRYSKEFNMIELNASHYATPSLEQVKKWNDKVGEAPFLFCPKFPRAISHAPMRLDDAKKIETNNFLDSIHLFGAHLGPCFMQMIEYYPAGNKEELLQFLSWTGSDENMFVEVRHPSWFANQETMSNWCIDLRAAVKGWVICDTPARRDAVHMMLTGPCAFVRFVCAGDNPLDRFRIIQWKEVLAEWFSIGLERCYFVLHVHDPLQEAAVYAIVRQEFNQLSG